jgi:hypothetical protein
MLTVNEQALEIYNHAIKYVAAYHSNISGSEAIKKQALIYSGNVIYRMKEAVFNVARIDDYKAHKTLDFYESVMEKIKTF